MQIRRALLVSLAAVPVLVAAVSAFAGLLAVGDEVPDVTLTMSDGKDQKLSTHEGRAVVLFFYGTWSKKAPGDAATVL